MTEIRLQFNLPNDMLLHFGLSNAFLRHLLDYTEEAQLLLSSHENLSECAFT